MSAKLINPLRSAKLIANTAINVKLNENAIQTLAISLYEAFKENPYDLKRWKEHELHPKEANENSVNWIFFIDSLNFSFWSEQERNKQEEESNSNSKCDDNNKNNGSYRVTYKGKQYTGYWSLCAAVNRALDECIPLTNPDYYSSITEQQLENALRGDNNSQIPLFEQRVKVLHEAGNILNTKFNNSFLNCVRKCEQSAIKLLELIVTNFPSFRDEAIYNGEKVTFYKRAQILVADIWACFEGRDDGLFFDINEITMFADYRVPQVLAYYGVLNYSPELMKKLQNDHLYTNGDQDEIEIRALSILAVDKLAMKVNQLLNFNEISKVENYPINSIIIDFYLWDFRRLNRNEIDKIPFHKVRSIYY